MEGKKGCIAVGYDADLIIFDDTARFTICPEIIKYRHKITPYEGREVYGVVERTLLRGIPVFVDGEILGGPEGRPILGRNKKV